MNARRYIVSWAQNATPVHKGFLAAMETYAEANDAEIVVIPGRYKNPTSVFTREQEEGEWWADEVRPYLAARTRKVKDGVETIPERRKLCKGLTVYADLSIQPTATRPLTGFEVFMGASSGIFGHPKRALEVVPTASRTPRLQYTTSACTVQNYTDSKAGKKGHAHHVIGAVVVEVDSDGVFFVRHVSASDKNGSFTDLDTVYTANGTRPAPRALSIVMGDIHSGEEDEEVLEASEALCGLVRPHYLLAHDVLDFSARSHHQTRYEEKFDHRFDTVEAELVSAAATLRRLASWGPKVVVVRSNHDEAFEKWLNNLDVVKSDPANEPYWTAVRHRRHEERKRTGEWADCFAQEARHHGVPAAVRFLRKNESFSLADVEHGFHGHVGLNGARGSKHAFVKLGVKVSTGHTHVPHISDGLYTAGVTARLDHGYNDLPCAWVHAHILLYADGKRSIVVINRGRFRGAQVQRAAALKRAA